MATIIEDEDALAMIKTSPDDNERMPDKIEVDREMVARRAIAQARTKAQTTETIFDIKLQQLEVLAYMQQHLPPGFDLQGVVRNGIRNSRQKREFEKLVRQIVKERRENGSVFATTVTRFELLVNRLWDVKPESTEVESVDGVLFYHSQ
jgi:hypothetical protein